MPAPSLSIDEQTVAQIYALNRRIACLRQAVSAASHEPVNEDAQKKLDLLVAIHEQLVKTVFLDTYMPGR